MLPAIAAAAARVFATKTVKSLLSADGSESVKSVVSGLGVEVQVNDIGLRYYLRKAPGQIRFATAKALTRTAQDVQTAEVRELHRAFTIRSLWWKKNRRFGIKVKPARVTGAMESRVFTNAYWLKDHVVGATRIPQGRHRAVPKSEKITRKKSGQVSKSWLPSQIKNRFSIDLGQNALLFKWLPSKKEKELVYLLIPRARIKRSYDWFGVGKRTVKKNWGRHMQREMKAALRTAK